jgi:uncharacterized membrane protein YgcG
MRRPTRLTGITVLVAAWTFALATPAHAQTSEVVHGYDVAIDIESSGSIVVTETIDYDFGTNERHGIYRDVPERFPYGNGTSLERVYRIEVLSVTATGSASADHEVLHENGYFRIRIGDPNRTTSGRHTYTIEYRVEGALNGFPDHDELYWNAIGTEWDYPIERSKVTVTAPAQITQVTCFAGPEGSTLGCAKAKVGDERATFTNGELGPKSAFTVVVGLPKGAVPEPTPILEERWSLGRAFEANPPTVAVAVLLGVAVVVGFAMLVWRIGRDRRYRGSAVDALMGSPTGEEQTVPLFEGDASGPVEFAPPADLRPGQIGTLVDETANPLDVTATIVDLAVRKYLVIEEISKHGWFGKPDWNLRKLKDADHSLLEYERLLLNGLFESGPEVKLSELKSRFVARLRKVQEALYRNGVQERWFVGSPEKVRQRWAGIGVGVLVLGGVLEYATIRWTKLALLPLPVIAAGVLLMMGSHWMPRRTAKGTALARRIRGFRTVIATAETNMARFAEKENLFTRYLPYAIVFGLTDKWAKAFASLGEQPSSDMSWYVSTRPFVIAEFAGAIDGFSVTTAGTIAATPGGSGSSGLGGGGFSGGGGGGGGGGSW